MVQYILHPLTKLSHKKVFAWRNWIKVGDCLTINFSTQLGRTTSWSPRPMFYSSENEILQWPFCQNWRSFNKQQYFCKSRRHHSVPLPHHQSLRRDSNNSIIQIRVPVLLSNGLIQRTPCKCTLTDEVILMIRWSLYWMLYRCLYCPSGNSLCPTKLYRARLLSFLLLSHVVLEPPLLYAALSL